MKKIINDPDNFVDEMIEGLLKAHPEELRTVGDDLRELVRKDAPVKDKVAIATGGGSGHLPIFLGYVGKGMLDGVVIGDVFASPSAQQMYNVTKEIDSGKGVLYLYGNYGGDCMNFDMASEMAEMDDIKVETVLVTDDVASSPKGEEEKRRGVAGLVFAYKIAGAKAAAGAELEEVAAVTRKALSNIRTMGVALSPCTIPQVGKPTFEIADDEMEIGMGIHGEPGIHRGPLKSADEIAETILAAIFEDGPYTEGDEVAVLLNGLGATPQEELYIVYRKVAEILNDKGIKIYRNLIGEYATSMEMAGMSITLLKLDEELKDLLDAPADTPFFSQANIR
ncbi:dihydroxyacetone kinase subunit DhaK [Iocasia frigidifontis]|uniref:phosphoenolpyruvate--glycerone phosphotransferase n=1 Tax=Iocasia fonsfrigidae TaxID=2682810 RepID=A0A8A7KJ02_9FIRM|nr:dihydroxyacetone kinase subunit DhaK [Iocasia fonsfrigidae]QTL99569.1 dihydroxyacetone kinase subunit DhaK [Iocasia fonsfrigidae]